MANQTPKTEPSSGTVVGSISPKWYKNRRLLAIALVVVLATVAAGWYFFLRPSNEPQDDEYVIYDYSTQNLTDEELRLKTPDYNKDLDNLKKKIDAAPEAATYEDYLALAQLYVALGDKENAIANYEIAKSKIGEDVTGHHEYWDRIDSLIAGLKEEQQQ